jgi:homoserine kinase type II
MAVKTILAQAEIQVLLSGYDLGELLGAEPIGQGTVQTNYLLRTRRGKFVLRLYENRSFPSVQFECDLVCYLRAKRYPCPGIVPDRRGRSAGQWGGKPFVIFEFIEGQHLENPGPDQQRQLIWQAAKLQVLTRGYRPARRRFRWNYDPALCQALAQKAAQDSRLPSAAAKLAWHTAQLSALRLPYNLPKGICHCDFHFSNSLFQDGQFAALIDFDDANYTYLCYDLICLIDPFVSSFNWDTWQRFAPGSDIFDFQPGRWVLNEYMRVRPLLALEKRHLFDVYKLSILFDCIWYFERGDAADFYEKRKIEALDELGRAGFYHNLFET